MNAEDIVIDEEYHISGDLDNGYKDGKPYICHEEITRPVSRITDTHVICGCGRRFLRNEKLTLTIPSYRQIYQKSIQAVDDGANFKVDFPSRSLKLSGQYIIHDGQYKGPLGVPPCSREEFFTTVECLYQRYKHSIPSERSESKSHHYFTALPEKSLSDEAMLYGQRRDKAQIELELYVLCQILNGFQWNPDTMGTWFWQSKEDKDLVILRSWVEPNNNNH